MINKTIQLNEANKNITLTTYLLDDSPKMLNGRPRPIVVICPGGGYHHCSDREGEPVAMAFNAMGYHAAVLRYSVSGIDIVANQNDLEDVNALEFDYDNCHPQPIRDIGRAMLWIHDNADEYYIDVKKIILCGFSAGGHNVTLFATSWYKPVICDFFGEGQEKFRPAAVISSYAITDFVFMEDYLESMNEMDRNKNRLIIKVFTGTEKPDKTLLEEISPSKQVSEYTPPMFLWATSEDTMVPVQHTLNLANSLADKKIPFDLRVFEEGKHGLGLATHASASSKNHILPDVAKWIGLVEEWLDKRFALEFPDDSPWG